MSCSTCCHGFRLVIPARVTCLPASLQAAQSLWPECISECVMMQPARTARPCGSCAVFTDGAACRTRLQELLLHGPQPQQQLALANGQQEMEAEASHAQANGHAPEPAGGSAPSMSQLSTDALARGVACERPSRERLPPQTSHAFTAPFCAAACQCPGHEKLPATSSTPSQRTVKRYCCLCASA